MLVVGHHEFRMTCFSDLSRLSRTSSKSRGGSTGQFPISIVPDFKNVSCLAKLRLCYQFGWFVGCCDRFTVTGYIWLSNFNFGKSVGWFSLSESLIIWLMVFLFVCKSMTNWPYWVDTTWYLVAIHREGQHRCHQSCNLSWYSNSDFGAFDQSGRLWPWWLCGWGAGGGGAVPDVAVTPWEKGR